MNYSPLYIQSVPWKTIGAFFMILLFCGFAFYKEGFLLNTSDKLYYKRLEKKLNIKLSGRMIVSIMGALFAALSLLLSYIFYIKK